MIDGDARRWIANVADAATRLPAVAEIAAFVGADAMLAFVIDAEVGSLVPAVAFPKTLPGGAGWRALLDAARHGPCCAGTVDYPTADDRTPAEAWSVGRAVFVFVGPGCQRPQIASLLPLLPPIAALFASEHDVAVARGELRAVQDRARHAEMLARALDKAREDVARGLREVRRQAGALREAHDRAEHAARAKDEFLAVLGHELRNPLAPIVTALQLLRLRHATGREFEVIERQVGNMMRLIDDLLDVSRITRGRVELRREVVELSTVVADAVEIASREFERKQQRLQVSVPSTGLPVHGDRGRLIQVITNLLTNASKYSDERTDVDVRGQRIGDRIRISVADRGMGLRPEMLDRVFHMFVQAPQALDRAQGGLGLGLAIASSLVELHGGKLWAESPGPGQGSTFTADLPAAMQPSPPGQPLRYPPAPPQSAQRERILVVDDNEDARVMLAETLTALGYAVRTAADGPTAIPAAREFRPAAALLDIGLPVMDGYELAAQLRGIDQNVRLIAVTGYGQESDRQRTAVAGFDAHLVKPITIEDVANTLERLTSN